MNRRTLSSRPLATSMPLKLNPGHPLVFGLFAYYLSSLALEGPLRYVLTLAHVETLIYVRDLLALVTVLYWVQKPIHSQDSLLKPVTLAFYALVTHAVLALWLGNPIVSILFAFKVFIAVLYGMAVADAVSKHENLLKLLMQVLFMLSIIGVFLNYFYGTFPWEGETFESAFGSIKTTKVWWAGGERRLAGFGRASYSAAMAIGLAGAYWMATTPYLLIRLFVFGSGMAAIYMTTSKGMVAAYALCGLWLLATPNNSKSTNKGLMIVLLLTALSIIIPLLALIYDGNPAEVRLAPPLLSSFWDRITDSWPSTFEQLGKKYGYVLGKGLGGAGLAVRMGAHNDNEYVAIDNVFWYLYSVFGAATLAYGYWFLRRVWRLPEDSPAFSRALVALTIVMVGYGLTSIMFEDAFFSILFGIVLAWPSTAQDKKRHA